MILILESTDDWKRVTNVDDQVDREGWTVMRSQSLTRKHRHYTEPPLRVTDTNTYLLKHFMHAQHKTAQYQTGMNLAIAGCNWHLLSAVPGTVSLRQRTQTSNRVAAS